VTLPLVAAALLRVAVLGDIQGYPNAEDAGMRNLERALDVCSALKPDVVAIVGDVNDSGKNADAVRYFKARCDVRLGDLPHVACLGNHELDFVPPERSGERTAARCLADFNAVFGQGPGKLVERTVLGYDFIALSFGSSAGYSADELDALKAALDRAVARDAAKPVFVLTHYHPAGTVNSSPASHGCDALRRLLDGYPQAVSLSGHTHNPLQDPRSIWQGAFTAVDTSTLCYGCVADAHVGANQVSCLIPYGHEAVGFAFVEVYADRLVIRRFSVRDRREIEPASPWTVPWPHDPAKAKYAHDARARTTAAPQFAGDPEPTLWYDYGYAYLMFAAADKDAVFGYRIELTGPDGEVQSHFHLSDYYRLPAARTDRIVFRAPPGSLKAGDGYRCRIFPVGFFGAEGRPCEWRFAIRPEYVFRTTVGKTIQE